MAYKIQYTPEIAYRYPQKGEPPHLRLGRWVAILSVLLAVVWMRINGVPDFLIPGDPVVTRSAAEMMLEEIRAGESVNDAVTVFCREVLNGAQN